jgi:hypothetical protein
VTSSRTFWEQRKRASGFRAKKLAKEMRASEEDVEQALAGPADGVSRFRCFVMEDGKAFFQPHAKEDENKRGAGGSFAIYDSGSKEAKAKRAILEKMYMECSTFPAPEGPPFSVWGQAGLKGGSTQETEKPNEAPEDQKGTGAGRKDLPIRLPPRPASSRSPFRAAPRKKKQSRSRSPPKKPRVEEVEETPAQIETDWRELRRKANIRILDIEQDKNQSRNDRAEAAEKLEEAKCEKIMAEDAHKEAKAMATEARKLRNEARENREATRVMLEQAQVQTEQLKSYLLESGEGAEEAKVSKKSMAKGKHQVGRSRSKSKHKATRTMHKRSKQGHKDRQAKKASSSHAPAGGDKTAAHKLSYDKTRKRRKKSSSSSSSEDGSSSSD